MKERNARSVASGLPARHFSDAEHANWYQNIMNIYDRMRAKAAHGPFQVDIAGLRLVVLPNVYDPVGFTDTLWFGTQLRTIVGQKTLLEIGSGSGAISIMCAQNGARVVASDINPDAVKNTRLNAERLHLNISVRQGDMYDPLDKDETFDFIFWSHPFNNWNKPVDDMLLRSGLDYHYESMRKYISGAREHLTGNGRLLLGTGDSADLETISDIAASNRYTMKLLRSVMTTLEQGGEAKVTLLLYELAPQSRRPSQA